MNKFLALALLLCLVRGSLATNVYVGVYTEPTCPTETLIEEISLPATSTCTADAFESSYQSLTSGSLFDYNCQSGCSSCTETSLDLSSGDCIQGVNNKQQYYQLTTTSVAPTYYISCYSSSTGALADLVWEQALVLNTCTTMTSDSTVQIMFAQQGVGVDLHVGCDDSGTCGSSCDASITGILNGYIIENSQASTDNYYLITSKSVQDASDDSSEVSSSGSILSFASVALCALFSYALLF